LVQENNVTGVGSLWLSTFAKVLFIGALKVVIHLGMNSPQEMLQNIL
jgi:hypothetical protein